MTAIRDNEPEALLLVLLAGRALNFFNINYLYDRLFGLLTLINGPYTPRGKLSHDEQARREGKRWCEIYAGTTKQNHGANDDDKC